MKLNKMSDVEVLTKINAKCDPGMKSEVNVFVEALRPSNDSTSPTWIQGWLPEICEGCLHVSKVEKSQGCKMLEGQGRIMKLNVKVIAFTNIPLGIRKYHVLNCFLVRD